MNDLYLPVNFVGLSTKDRRYIYPMKEVWWTAALLVRYAHVVDGLG